MPVSEVVQHNLEPYEIGKKVRALRAQKGWGLVEVGKRTELSAALLSKIERGRLVPTLPTLMRIALCFEVGLDHFFAAPRRSPGAVVSRASAPSEAVNWPDEAASAKSHTLYSNPAIRRFHAQMVEFEAGSPGGSHSHGGAEYLHILDGSLELTLGGEKHELGKGDSVGFEAMAPHSYLAVNGPSRALMISLGE